MTEHWTVDVQRFKEAVWAVERENFRPADALYALDRAKVDAPGVVGALERIRDKARLAEKDPGGAMSASWVEGVADDALAEVGR